MLTKIISAFKKKNNIKNNSFDKKENETKEDEKIIYENPNYCKICMEEYEIGEMYTILSCGHRYCFQCISIYVKSKIKESIYFIKCPNIKCKTILNQKEIGLFCGKEYLEQILNNNIDKLISEGNDHHKDFIRCPNKSCRNIILIDGEDNRNESKYICTLCYQCICLNCRERYHDGSTCVDKKKLYKEWKYNNDNTDKMFKEYVKKKQYKQCPNKRCGIWVSKISGCNYMYCRCRTSFYYK